MMTGKIYIVYIERAEGYCGSCAFVYNERLRDFEKISSHMSSNLDWARHDIRGVGHEEDYRRLFPDGYEFVEAGVFKTHFGYDDYMDIMDALFNAKDKEGAEG